MIDVIEGVGPGSLGLLRVERPHALHGTEFALPAPRAVIGRTGDVRLDSALVSRRHAIIFADDGEVWLRDAGSANGTFLNGVRVSQSRLLHDGDRVGVGDVVAVFARTPASGTAAAGVPNHAPTHAHARTETTRYLSAAVHLDRQFRAKVLDATVRATHRAVCPSYGVDLSVVARHAVVAQRRELVRDAVLTTVLGLAVFVAGVWWRSSGPAVGGLFVAVAALIAMAVVAVGTETWMRFETLGRFLQWGKQPDRLPAPTGRIAATLQDLAPANDGNVVVFTVYDPFVGSGALVDEGSFTVPLIPQQAWLDQTPARLPRPLRSGEVVDTLAHSLRTLSQPHMRVDTRLYVSGHNVVQFPSLLPDPLARPRSHAPQQLLRQTLEQPTGIVRPYLCVEFSSWQGQLVVTSFIRVVALPGVLYLESAAYLLPPLKAAYYRVDRLRVRTAGERMITTISRTAQTWLPALFAAPIRLVTAADGVAAAGRGRREHRRRIAERVLVDYGAVTSIREEASGEAFHSHFMQQDADMYVQVVQQKVVDTLTALLDERGFQTDKIKQIQNTSYNFNGGSQNIGAIGSHARGEVAPARAARQGATSAK